MAESAGPTQRHYRAPCPGCGAPVEFRSAQSTTAVCGYCQSTVVRQGEVLSRTELSEHIYPHESDRDSNTIEVFVGRLRKKLPAGSIETVRGLGYMLAKP